MKKENLVSEFSIQNDGKEKEDSYCSRLTINYYDTETTIQIAVEVCQRNEDQAKNGLEEAIHILKIKLEELDSKSINYKTI